MRDRLTVRVVLLDPADRVLLMKGRLPASPRDAGAWFTVGGGAAPGETLLEAARREVREETGFTEVDFGPVVWCREGPLTVAEGPVMMRERYMVARCAGGEPDRGGWDAAERRLIDDIRWWPAAELATCRDPVYPPGLARLLPGIIAGCYGAEPLKLPW